MIRNDIKICNLIEEGIALNRAEGRDRIHVADPI